MTKPRPQHEIYTEVLPNNNLHIYTESSDMEDRVVAESSKFGEVTISDNLISICVRPTFDQIETAKWLGRGGPVVRVNYLTRPTTRTILTD